MHHQSAECEFVELRDTKFAHRPALIGQCFHGGVGGCIEKVAYTPPGKMIMPPPAAGEVTRVINLS